MGNEVFFLGAGFSKAVQNSFPTLNELTEDIEERIMVDGNQVVRKLYDKIPNNYKYNIEVLLTYLNSNLPFKNFTDVQEDIALYGYITEYIKDILGQIEIIINWKYQKFAQYLIKNNVTCITLNYDTLLENLIYRFVDKKYVRGNPSYVVFYKFAIDNLKERISNGIDGFPTRSQDLNRKEMPEIIKLHGSMNWLHNGKTVFCANGKEEKFLSEDLQTLIVPPIIDKSSLYKIDIFNVLWIRAFKALVRAENIYICGFSFPITDLSIRYLFQSALNINKQNPKIYVINTINFLKETKDRYDEIFNGFQVDYSYCCNDSLIKFSNEFLSRK